MSRIQIYFLLAVILFPGAMWATEVDSLAALEAAVKVAPKDGAAWVRLGYACLDAGDLKRAKEAFWKGAKGPEAARAFNGLGLVYTRDTKRGTVNRKGLEFFRRALGADPGFVEAEMNIARLHMKFGELDAEKVMLALIERHPTYTPAYLVLAEWYSDSGYEDRMVDLYRRYLELVPGDLDGQYGLAVTYTEQRRYGLVLGMAEAVLKANPEEVRFLPVAGQAYAARGQADRALDRFQAYFAMVDDGERALYEDLSLVALPEEIEVYRALVVDEREEFLERFWRKRDLTLVAGGAGRRAEHYRRVWYARTYFSKKTQPWDRRGEVYVRYGEPDYRSRSGRVNPPPSSAVEAVKEQHAAVIYTDEWKESMGAPPEVGGGGPLTEPVYPVDRFSNLDQQSLPGTVGMKLRDHMTSPQQSGSSRVPWESWVYVSVGEGVEFVFTDQVNNGTWDFAPPPKLDMFTKANILQLSMVVNRFSPAAVLAPVGVKTPDRYTLPPGIMPLEFYYDTATFRASSGMTKLEVYFGIPLDQVENRTVDGQDLCEVEWRVALVDQAGEEVYRGMDQVVFNGMPNAARGTFAPEAMFMRVPPGAYRMAVQLTDVVSGKWNVYQQEVLVPAYTDSLAMSDLELAWGVMKTRQPEKFRKGDVWVIPMPSRNYRKEQAAHVYYEVYNFQKDTFGQTRYRVAYTIRRDVRRGFSLYGAMTGVFRTLMSRGDEAVVVQYEREGAELWEPIYFELDTEKLAGGLNEIEVEVTDLVRGRSVSRKAMFRVE
ncbi:MAG: GWxTD domain-containing protein [bacterium]|nr:GWxTD domain-containing protein [bacterium]